MAILDPNLILEEKENILSFSCLSYTWLGGVKKAFNAVSQLMRPLKPTHKQETDIKWRKLRWKPGLCWLRSKNIATKNISVSLRYLLHCKTIIFIFMVKDKPDS